MNERYTILTQKSCPYHDSDHICLNCYQVFLNGKRVDWRKRK